MNRNYGFEIVRATEIAAINAARDQGLGKEIELLTQAREAICNVLGKLDIKGFFKNDRFSTRMGSLPEFIGIGEDEVDIIMAEIEGHKVCAKGGNNSTSYIAIGPKNSFMEMPNLYMNKIAVGSKAYGAVDLNQAPIINVKRVARALNKYIENVTVCILDRERNASIIQEIQSCGARIKLIQDGDISGCIATEIGGKVDVLMGIGSSKEGVLAAAALKSTGGYFQGKIIAKNDEDLKKANALGIKDLNKIYDIDDLIQSEEIAFAATGVTDGAFLEGVRFHSDGATTHSFVARSKTKTIRYLQSRHYFDYKPVY